MRAGERALLVRVGRGDEDEDDGEYGDDDADDADDGLDEEDDIFQVLDPTLPGRVSLLARVITPAFLNLRRRGGRE